MPIIIDPQNPVQNLDYNTTVTEVIPVEIPLFDDDLEIIQKLDDEPNDVGGLTAAELKAKFDEGNLTAQTYINNVLIPQVVADDATEQARQLAESERVANEIIRVANEENRILRETARDTNEAARQQSIAKVQNMTASATTVPYGTPAAATITTDPDTGAFNIGLGIPQGKPGTGDGDMEKAVYDPNNKSTDIFAYVDNGLEGKAPAGFGLGSLVTVADFNLCTANGFYAGVGSGTLNAPAELSYGGMGCVLSIRRYDNIYHLYFWGAISVSGPVAVVLRHSEDGGATWKPWEYFNPPMKLGVEYRTTERYLGKPVYQRLYDCGVFPEANGYKTISLGIQNLGNIVNDWGTTEIAGMPLFANSSGLTLQADYNVVGTTSLDPRIVVRCGDSRPEDGYKLKVCVKYTKTTD